MAKRLTNNVITGSDKRLGLYFYYSPFFGHNIIRKTTSLTGARVKTETAFKGFRESSNRMKQASPIAASLYRLISAECKQYSMYRLLTSEALKMIKKGLETEIIIETLTKIYIEPLIKDDQKPCKSRVVRKRHQNQVLQNADQTTEFQTASEFSNDQPRNGSVRVRISPPAQGKYKQASDTNEVKIPGLIYLGRLPDCKNLKMWLRSANFPYPSD